MKYGVDTEIKHSVDDLTTTIHPGNRYKQRVVNYLAGVCGCAQVIVHNASVVNVRRGIIERVLYVFRDGELQATPKPVVGVFDKMADFKERLVSSMTPTTVVSAGKYPLLYDSRKRARYQAAVESLAHSKIAKSDAVVNTFVKAEKVVLKPTKVDPAPRVIQPRSYRFNVCIGRYLKLFEKELFRGLEAVAGYKVVFKGMNAEEMATAMHGHWSEFVDPVGVGLDASRFDQHVSKEALQFEHDVYNQVFKSAKLAEWLSWQLENKGRAFVDGQKISYEVEGCRMSGDINTSMGNCLIMSAIVLCYLESIQVKSRLVNNGDDCVVIVERKHLPLLDNIDNWFKIHGFTLTKEPAVDCLEAIEFCQMHPVCVDGSWRMIRNPYTAITKDCTTLLSWGTKTLYNNWSKSIGVAGLSMTGGVPVWQAFHSSLVGLEGKVTHRFEDEGVGRFGCGAKSGAVLDSTRFSFWKAFGMLPDVQVAIEKEFQRVPYAEPVMFADIKSTQVLQHAAAIRTEWGLYSNSSEEPTEKAGEQCRVWPDQ